MPNKYPNKKGWTIPKQKYKVSNWREYNNALRNRANIEIWISDDIIHAWYEKDRVYDGKGAPQKFTDLAIITCHEIRQVFRLALRQCQGFMNSIFKMKALNIKSPDYSCLSKRLALLTALSQLIHVNTILLMRIFPGRN
ncbi:transposase [Candidiatus Paracoxiella cheracis]|uniref:transposase n=1 Tax=Candidiatus Paracoxiella cheracis TaxID=3405120 RepID=UPI003BF5E88E